MQALQRTHHWPTLLLALCLGANFAHAQAEPAPARPSASPFLRRVDSLARGVLLAARTGNRERFDSFFAASTSDALKQRAWFAGEMLFKATDYTNVVPLTIELRGAAWELDRPIFSFVSNLLLDPDAGAQWVFHLQLQEAETNIGLAGEGKPPFRASEELRSLARFYQPLLQQAISEKGPTWSAWAPPPGAALQLASKLHLPPALLGNLKPDETPARLIPWRGRVIKDVNVAVDGVHILLYRGNECVGSVRLSLRAADGQLYAYTLPQQASPIAP